MRVLVTRPEKEGRATAARLAALGHEARLEPLTAIVAVEHPALPAAETLQAVTATSLNAVEVLVGRDDLAALRDLPFFAVGERTARAAREAGFTDVRSADGDRRDLVAAITAALDPASGAILWLVGHDRAGDLVADLAPAGFRVEAVEVYRAEPVARLSETTRQAIAAGEIDAGMVFSPRSGAILLEKLAECGFSPGSLRFPVHVISEATARPFREAGWREVVVASSPNTDAMLATLGPAPVSATPGGEDTRSSAMSPKSDKGRSKTEAAIEAQAVESPVEPGAAGDLDRIEPETTPEGIAGASAAEVVAPAAPTEPEPAPAARAAASAVSSAASSAPVAPQVTVVKRGGFGLALVATLLGGVAGVGGTYGLALQGLLPGTGGEARVAAVESKLAGLTAPRPADAEAANRIAALEKRLAGLAAPTAAGDPALAGRVEALEKQIAGLAALETRVAALQAPTATTPAAAVDLSGLEGRIAALEGAKPAPVDLTGLEGRLARLEAAPKSVVDLSGVEERLTRLEAVPPSRLPVDLADRVAGLEAAAKARADAAQTSVAGALSSIAAEGASKQALAEMAGQVDRALGSLRESAGAEIASLKARIERLGGGIDAESRAMVERTGADAKALAARLGIETQAVADRLAAQTAATVEELRKRNDELTRSLTERMTALVAASDLEGRRRIEELARGVAEKSTALAAALEADARKRGEETAAALKKLAGELEAAAGRLSALETTSRDAGSTGQKMVEKVGEAAAAAETRVGALENRLTGIVAEAEAARRTQGQALVVIALAELKSAVEAGRPFVGEIGVVDAAAKGAVDLAALKPFAATGVPTATTLRAGWAKVARAAVAAGEPPSAGGVFDRLLANAGSVVKVRPTGEVAGDDVASIAARVEARLAAGDLAGAQAAWTALPEASRKASADWGATLGARVGVDKALAAQTAAVTAKLTQQGQ